MNEYINKKERSKSNYSTIPTTKCRRNYGTTKITFLQYHNNKCLGQESSKDAKSSGQKWDGSRISHSLNMSSCKIFINYNGRETI